MVFKVKQRASYSYDNVILDTINSGDPRQETAYSYNWPYDFFSLVELAKIDVTAQLGGEIPIKPPDMSVPASIANLRDSAKQGGPELVAGATKTMSDISRDFVGEGTGLETKDKNEILIDILNKRS